MTAPIATGLTAGTDPAGGGLSGLSGLGGPGGAGERLDIAGLDPDAALLVHRSGPVVTITLNRPDKHNAQTPATWLGLATIGRALPGDVRVVVLAGAGRSFSSGIDRAVLAAGLAVTDEDIAGYQDGFSWLSRPDLLTVAAVQGYALGAGFQLALACDLRVLADTAQLALPEPSLGLVPDLGGTYPLVRAVGYSRALEITLTGRRVAAAEALSLGLATTVVAEPVLRATVDDLVGALLGPLRDAAVETKALLLGAVDNDPVSQRAAERGAQVRRFASLAALAAGN